MNKLIITTGYMGSGSSAMTDLMSEFDGFLAPNNSFEYVLLHCPNGIFDLEEKLTSLNNANRSDEAIRMFIKTMEMLYETPETRYWIAGYKQNISDEFMLFVNEFLKDIGVMSINGTWYNQQFPGVKYELKKMIWKIKKKMKLQNNPIPSNYTDMKLAFPSKLEYYEAAKRFLKKIYFSLGLSDYNLIMDQLVLPHNISRASNYFETDSSYFFVVDRDPRDVFILNKYFWTNNPLPYPVDVHEFCVLYKKIRDAEQKSYESNVFRIHFEDLIYNYENSLEKIYGYLNLSAEEHTRKKTKFIPTDSINNTQVFRRNTKYKKESDYIAESLKEYIFPFPFNLQSKEKVF